MSHPDLTDEIRIIADWTAVLVDALAAGDRARAAMANATIAQATCTIQRLVDPHRVVCAAVTHSNGHYIAPEPRS